MRCDVKVYWLRQLERHRPSDTKGLISCQENGNGVPFISVQKLETNYLSFIDCFRYDNGNAYEVEIVDYH